jgi:Na+-driven multidrug efflux pump
LLTSLFQGFQQLMADALSDADRRAQREALGQLLMLSLLVGLVCLLIFYPDNGFSG